jgi:hypothetical protein
MALCEHRGNGHLFPFDFTNSNGSQRDDSEIRRAVRRGEPQSLLGSRLAEAIQVCQQVRQVVGNVTEPMSDRPTGGCAEVRHELCVRTDR